MIIDFWSRVAGCLVKPMLSQIQKLREVTGAGVMECRKAWEEAGGDLEKAIQIIRARGMVRADNRKDRATGAGLLEAYIHNDRVGVLLEMRAETDFAVHSLEFKSLAHNLAMQIAAMKPNSVEELMKQAYIRDESRTVEELVKETISRTGENIRVEKFCRYEL